MARPSRPTVPVMSRAASSLPGASRGRVSANARGPWAVWGGASGESRLGGMIRVIAALDLNGWTRKLSIHQFMLDVGFPVEFLASQVFLATIAGLVARWIWRRRNLGQNDVRELRPSRLVPLIWLVMLVAIRPIELRFFRRNRRHDDPPVIDRREH